jgi:aspartate racemase
MMNRRKIGILGGMGTAAGLYFTQKLIELNASAGKDSDHPSFILYSDPHIPSRVDAYLSNTTSPSRAIANSLDKLSSLGADFGVVICNTAHIYFDEIEQQVALPLINMIGNVAQHVAKAAPGKTIGLLATTATARSSIYPRHVEAAGNAIALPCEADQDLISDAIFDPVFGIKSTGTSVHPQAQRIISDVAQRLRREQGVQHLILGCTELSMAIADERWNDFTIFDPVKLLARTCLQRAGFTALH